MNKILNYLLVFSLLVLLGCEYKPVLSKKNYEFSDRKKREIFKILNSTQNKRSNFIKLKKKFIHNLINDRLDFAIRNYLTLSNMIDKPKIYSQFSGFRSDEISDYLNKIINLDDISSYAEIGCPLWGNYNYFKKPWIKQYFINIICNHLWNCNLQAFWIMICNLVWNYVL